MLEYDHAHVERLPVAEIKFVKRPWAAANERMAWQVRPARAVSLKVVGRRFVDGIALEATEPLAQYLVFRERRGEAGGQLLWRHACDVLRA